MASKPHLELLFLCQCFNGSSKVGKNAQALNLSLDAISRARISQLVREKNGLEAQDSEGWTPLIAAASYDHEDVVQELLDAGADPNIPDCKGLTAMHYAAERNFPRILQLLARNRANVNAQSYIGHDSPLMFAVRGNNLQLVRLLLTFGADAHCALATARMFGHNAVAQLLQMHCRMQHYMSVVAASCCLRAQHPQPTPHNSWAQLSALALSYVQFDVVSSSSVSALQQHRMLLHQQQRLLCLARSSLVRILVVRLQLHQRMQKPRRWPVAVAKRCAASLPHKLMMMHACEEERHRVEAEGGGGLLGRWQGKEMKCVVM